MRKMISHIMMLAVLISGFCTVSQRAVAQSPADLAECKAYTFDADSLSRTIVAMGELTAAGKEDADLKKALDGMNMGSSGGTLASMTETFSANSKAVEIAKSHGFEPHEFVVASMELVFTAFVVGDIKNGGDREKDVANPDINKANVELLENSPDAWDSMTKIMK